MSKNFELLQNLGKERTVFQAPAAPVPVPVEERPAVDLKPLELEMQAGQRDEMFKLVQRVFFTPGAGGSHLVVVAATESGNGCSWICARMAEVLASQVRGSVCVVDAHLRAPALHREFGVSNHFGLTDALQAHDPVRNFVTQLSRSNLWLLSCGADVEGAQTLLASDRMRALLPELRRTFDYVLIDAPPLRSGDDTIALGRNAEGVVLVLRANTSRRETARQVVQDLKSHDVRILGAVLNQRTYPVPESIYKKL
jgi:Mrp family chromosome partitioning ATPase